MLPAPAAPTLDALLPAELPLLMGVGPTPLPPSVAQANTHLLNHLGPLMNEVVESLQVLARYVFQTENRRVFAVSGPGSAAMEMAVANLAWPGRRVLAVVNGTFSERAAIMAGRAGATVDKLELPAGQGATAPLFAEALSRGPYDLVTMVQGETSCGVCNHALPELARMARAAGAMVLADTVVTLSTMPFQMDEWGIDVAYSAGQKGLACIPGVSLITFSDRAWEQLGRRPLPPAQWVLDAKLAEKFYMGHQYHYTAPTTSLLALHEALRLIVEETLPARHQRHAASSAALQRGLEGLGLELFVAPEHRLSTALAIRTPKGIDAAELCRRIEADHGVQIAGAFGLPIFRIGQLGEQCRPEPVRRTLLALGHTLRALGWDCEPEKVVTQL